MSPHHAYGNWNNSFCGDFQAGTCNRALQCGKLPTLSENQGGNSGCWILWSYEWGVGIYDVQCLTDSLLSPSPLYSAFVLSYGISSSVWGFNVHCMYLGRNGGETKGSNCGTGCHDGVVGVGSRTGRYIWRDQLHGVQKAVSSECSTGLSLEKVIDLLW